MFKRAAEALKIRNPLPRTAGVSRMLREAKRYGNGLRIIRTRNAEDLRKGDIGMIKKGGGTERDIGRSWEGHAYTITGVASSRIVETVEGNSNKDGSRNGYMVVERKRDATKTLAHIRAE